MEKLLSLQEVIRESGKKRLWISTEEVRNFLSDYFVIKEKLKKKNETIQRKIIKLKT